MIDKDAALWFPKEQQSAEVISGLSCVLGPGQMENLWLRCVSGRWVSTWKQVEMLWREWWQSWMIAVKLPQPWLSR